MSLLMSRKLKYFVTCFEKQSVNIAAESLCITRTPLSRVLLELEEQAGGKLFVRKYNQLEPTNLACTLYEKVKPVYDILCGIENQYMTSFKSSGIELLCDFSVPYVIYQHICIKLKKMAEPAECRRICIGSNEIQSIVSNPNILLYSFRKLNVPEYLTHHEFRSEALVLLLPEFITEETMNDFTIMKNIKLYIRKGILSSTIKGFVMRSISTFIPYIDVRETEDDTVSILFRISSGEGMMLLPEFLASYLSPPRTHKIKVPDTLLQSGFYLNKRNQSQSLVQNIIEIIASLTK